LFPLAILYGLSLLLTELLSNAAVAGAAFATPFGYHTKVLVYQVGGYSYLDFVKVGLPLNLLTWIVGCFSIPYFFPV
jgi:di/tricarboxylate transporter